MFENRRHGYLIWECTNLACTLRFPAAAYEENTGRCPVCGSATAVAAAPRNISPGPRTAPAAPLPHLELLLDNLRSTYNVGAIFRTADGAGVRELHLCGITATPANPKVAKTALGAADQIAWRYYPNGVSAAEELLKNGRTLWALEEAPEAENLLAVSPEAIPERLVLIVGHEVVGIDPALLERCSRILALPMMGIKESLNVTIACGTAVYHLLHGHNPGGSNRANERQNPAF